MALYEYRCGKCNHRFEEIVRSSEFSLTRECPLCQAVATKLISSFAVHGASGGSDYSGSFAGCESGPCGGAAPQGGCCGGSCSGH